MQPTAFTASFADHQFTLADTSFVSGVPIKSIRNWRTRGVLAVGERHFTGQRVYSLFDVVILAVMHDLAVRMRIPLAHAAQAAELASHLAAHAVATDELPDLLDADARRPNLNLLIAVKDSGELILSPADIRHPGAYLPPHFTELVESPMRRAHIVVPVYAILADAIRRVGELLRREQIRSQITA